MYTHVRRYRTVFSNAYSVVSQKSCIFYVSYTYTDIQQYDAIEARIRTERIRYKDTIQGYDTYRTDRIRYKDTIQGYDTKYDTRILLTIGKIKSPKNQIKTYALDLMNMVMITHFCNWPTFWWSPAFFFVETLVFVTRNHWHSMQLIPLFGDRPSFLGYQKWVRDSG